MKQTIIIVAISSRAYVQAALEAGFDVIAINAFADVDTQAKCKQLFQVDVQNGQFDAQQLIATLNKIDLSHCLDLCLGLCFGAGFEAQPDLLARISERIPLLGNTTQTVAACKNPQLLAEFCANNHIAIPVIQFTRPINTSGWLQKYIGGSGGAHIKPVLPMDKSALSLEILNNHVVYYQKVQAGIPYSCLFLAHQKNSLVIGFNEQWCTPSSIPNSFLPYRFGGAVSHAELNEQVKKSISECVSKATVFFGLNGMNSCDFLLHDNAIYLLEINPRLSATMGLYTCKKGNLLTAHVQACEGNLLRWPVVEKQAHAMQIVYANNIAYVPVDMDWPDWVSDIPQPNSEIPAGAPICTVVADARTAKLAKQKVLQRAASL